MKQTKIISSLKMHGSSGMGRVSLGIMGTAYVVLILAAVAAMVNIGLAFVALPLWLNAVVAMSLLAIAITFSYMLFTKNSQMQWGSQSKTVSTLGMLAKGILSSLPAGLVIGGVFALLVAESVLMLTPLTALIACATLLVGQSMYSASIHYWRGLRHGVKPGSFQFLNEASTVAPVSSGSPAKPFTPVASNLGDTSFGLDQGGQGSKALIDFLVKGVVKSGLLQESEAQATAVNLLVMVASGQISLMKQYPEEDTAYKIGLAIADVEAAVESSNQVLARVQSQSATAESDVSEAQNFVKEIVASLNFSTTVFAEMCTQMRGGNDPSMSPKEPPRLNLSLNELATYSGYLERWAKEIFDKSQAVYCRSDSSLIERLNCLIAISAVANFSIHLYKQAELIIGPTASGEGHRHDVDASGAISAIITAARSADCVLDWALVDGNASALDSNPVFTSILGAILGLRVGLASLQPSQTGLEGDEVRGAIVDMSCDVARAFAASDADEAEIKSIAPAILSSLMPPTVVGGGDSSGSPPSIVPSPK